MLRYYLAILCFVSTTSAIAAEHSAVEIKGRVTDPDGNAISARVRIVPPLSDVKLDEHGRERLIRTPIFKNEETLDVKTNPKGEFNLTLNPLFGNWSDGVVIAEADGFGPTWQRLGAAQHETELTLRLVKAADITGRLVDSNGKPIAGAEVAFKGAYRFHDENLEEFLKTSRDKPLETDAFVHKRAIAAPQFIKSPDRFKTDADGKFTIPSIGIERVVSLSIYAEGHKDSSAMVVTRPLGAKWRRTKLDEDTRTGMRFGGELPVVYPHQFTHVALPAAKVSGFVVNRETQEPMANVGVIASGKGAHGVTFTNKEGRFELDRLPPEGVLKLIAMRPPPEMVKAGQLPVKGPLPMQFLPQLKRRLSYAPARLLPPQKFELSRAMIAKGRVTDESGQPVKQARVTYRAGNDNKAVLDLQDELESVDAQTDEKGAFELPVLPGVGILLVTAGDGYQRASADDVPLPKREGVGDIPAYGAIIQAEDYNLVKVISPPLDAENYEVDLQLKKIDKTDKVQVSILDLKGEPVTGAVIKSLDGGMPSLRHERRIESNTLTLPSPTQDQPITAIVRHRERKMGGVLILTTEGKKETDRELRLRPYGTLSGRFVRDGKPVPKLDFYVRVLDDELRAVTQRTGGGINDRIVDGRTDAEGRFRISEMICGQQVRFDGTRETIMTRKRKGFREEQMRVTYSVYTTKLSLRSGETRDLGDVECRKLPPEFKLRK